ncbi:unnamed protein product, partial [Thlaspi arvense]
MSSTADAERCQRIEKVVDSRDRISALPNDLLIQILLLVSTEDVVSTMVLSKRWRFLWTMVPKLEYKYTYADECEKVWKFLEKSLELHKAPLLETLCIQLGQNFTNNGDVRKWVANAVDRLMRKLNLELLWTAEPISLPKSLYTSKTLVKLTLSNKILMDVPSSVCLPSVKILRLLFVVYKDEDSLVRLLSGCSVLARSDTLSRWPTFFAMISHVSVLCGAHDKFLKSSILVTTLSLISKDPKALDFSGNTFSRLQRFILHPFGDFWLDLIPLILNKSPKLQILRINSEKGYQPGNVPLSWIQPSLVPRCLSSNLEFFGWNDYSGSEEEKQLMRYILANFKCLKEVTITLVSTFNLDQKETMVKELKLCLERVSTLSQLTWENKMVP